MCGQTKEDFMGWKQEKTIIVDDKVKLNLYDSIISKIINN